MAYEVDFLAVGDGKKSGDAIAVRFGELTGGRQTVVVIDGGTQQSGDALTSHIQRHYGTRRVDFAVLTHPDIDHASGMRMVLENLDVGYLLMHRPWEHAPDILDEFKRVRTVDGLRDGLRKKLDAAWELERIARKRGIEIVEPFAGVATDTQCLQVLGPTEEYYKDLLRDFRSAPEPKDGLAFFIRAAQETLREAVGYVLETIQIETLDDSGETSSENNSSAIILLTIDGKQFLFTGDAGIPALTRAANYADSKGIDLGTLYFLQVPHHGSKRNVGPTVLNRIRAGTAYISAAPDGAPKHPAKKVTNALIRRGSQVFATQGKALRHGVGCPPRDDWGSAIPIQFAPQVEA